MFKETWKGHKQVSKLNVGLHEPVRNIVRPTGTIVRGKTPSYKNDQMVRYEGALERDAITLFEASHNVLRYREQPTTIFYPDGARLRRYTPDFELELDTGELLYIEVKHTNSLDCAKVSHKLSCITKHFRASSMDYLVLTEKVIRQEPRLSNLRKICVRAQRIWPTAEVVQRVINLYYQHFPLSLLQTNHVLSKHNLNAYSLFVVGALSIELDKPITPESTVNLVKESDHAHFWI
jgi:hypothetical protein